MKASALLAVAVLALGGCSGFDGPAAATEALLLQVDSIEVLTEGGGGFSGSGAAGSARVSILANGWLRDGCSSLGEVTQSRADNVVTVTIPVTRRGEVCTAMVQAVSHPVVLEGLFAPGDYVVRVNSAEQRFRIG
jgi:hypothetical protein